MTGFVGTNLARTSYGPVTNELLLLRRLSRREGGESLWQPHRPGGRRYAERAPTANERVRKVRLYQAMLQHRIAPDAVDYNSLINLVQNARADEF
jgi:hypothetical protein